MSYTSYTMYLKNPNQHTKVFFLKDPVTEEVIRIPEKGGAKSLPDLANAVIRQVSEWDRVTDGRYSQQAKQEAADLKLTWQAYWNKVIQHQMCLRATEPEKVCWNDGFGDTIHRAASMVDDLIDKAPKFIKGAGQKAASLITRAVSGTGHKRLSGCSACGGTKVFDPNAKRNLGRAGKVNSIIN